jgi:hypothetical protein
MDGRPRLSGAISRFGLQGSQWGAACFRQETLFLFDHFHVLLGQVDERDQSCSVRERAAMGAVLKSSEPSSFPLLSAILILPLKAAPP